MAVEMPATRLVYVADSEADLLAMMAPRIGAEHASQLAGACQAQSLFSRWRWGDVAREIDAPKGVKPVEWRLLTNRAAPTLENAIELIDWYRAR